MKYLFTLLAITFTFANSAHAKWTIDVQKGLSCNPGSSVPKNDCQPAPASGEVCCKVYSASVRPNVSVFDSPTSNPASVKPIIGLKK